MIGDSQIGGHGTLIENCDNSSGKVIINITDIMLMITFVTKVLMIIKVLIAMMITKIIVMIVVSSTRTRSNTKIISIVILVIVKIYGKTLYS